MASFYIDTSVDGDLVRDEESSTFPSKEAARKASISALADMARDFLPDGDRRDFIADVRNADGRVIYTATLSLVGRWVE